jgi:hypothetical protein
MSLMALVEDELMRPRLLAQLQRERDAPGPAPFDWPAVWAKRAEVRRARGDLENEWW